MQSTLSLLSAPPQGHKVVPSLPFLDHRHYGGCLLAPCRLHISYAGLPAARGGVGFAVGAPPPARLRSEARRRLPAVACRPPRSALDGRSLPDGQAISGLAPRGRVLRRGREVSQPLAGAFHYYHLPRCGSPSRLIIATTFPCAR